MSQQVPMPPIGALAQGLAVLAHEAGRLILEHYRRPPQARIKDDSSPVTAADTDAEALILAGLAALTPDIPVIAEEEMAAGRQPAIAARFFLVDPLDGTKEFLHRNGEFTVNIALIEDGLPVLGVLLAPAKGRLFIGDGAAAYEIAWSEESVPENWAPRPIRARRAGASPVVLISRTHRDTRTDEYLAHYPDAIFLASGSSLKFGLVAAGEADLYPRLGPTMEWDIAAGHAVLNAAGGSVTRMDGTPLTYGKHGEGFLNPPFVARGREA